MSGAFLSVQAVPHRIWTNMDKKTLIIAQIIITCLMAFSMSGVMSAVGLGLTREWLYAWPGQFALAWPIAFVLTQVATRIAFPLAFRLRRFL